MARRCAPSLRLARKALYRLALPRDSAGLATWSPSQRRYAAASSLSNPPALAVAGRSRRLPGFDNTFWDAFIAVTSSDGAPVGARAIQLDQSSIALAVDSLSGGGWVLGGSDGWTQNPGGLSILSFGKKLLLELPSLAADPARHAQPARP